MAKYCCEAMHRNVESVCATHASRRECPDALVEYSAKFNEYSLIIHDGGNSAIAISFCPWCGTKLPESLRERWFLELESLGITDPFSEPIPEKFESEAWHRDV